MKRMLKNLLRLAFLTSILLAGVGDAGAASLALYGATGSNGVDGKLVILDPATGAVVQTIGNLVDAQGLPYGITGLAFHPTTGVLYGSTANASRAGPRRLVTIDPLTAEVTVIGAFDIGTNTLADLAFDPATGTLYGTASGLFDLYTVDLTNGAATLVGQSGLDFSRGAGLAIDEQGALYSTPEFTTGSLYTLDPTTGAAEVAAPLSGAPFFGAVNALAFDEQGTLYGSLTDRVGPSAGVHLVRIDPVTGAITDIGQSINDLDAIAFGPAVVVPEPSSFTLLSVGFNGLLLAAWRRRPRR